MKNDMLRTLKTKEVESKEDYQVVLYSFIRELEKLFKKLREAKKSFTKFTREEKARIGDLIEGDRKMTHEEYVKSFQQIENKVKTLLEENKQTYTRPAGFSPDYSTE